MSWTTLDIKYPNIFYVLKCVSVSFFKVVLSSNVVKLLSAHYVLHDYMVQWLV